MNVVVHTTRFIYCLLYVRLLLLCMEETSGERNVYVRKRSLSLSVIVNVDTYQSR